MAHISTAPLTDAEHERLAKDYPNVKNKGQRFIRTIEPVPNCILSCAYEEYKELIHNFKVRPDDTYIVTYPKTGTTWIQEMVWCLQHDVDTEDAKTKHLYQRSPFLDFNFLFAEAEKVLGPAPLPQLAKFGNSVQMADEMLSPRVIKTHLPFPLLPESILKDSKAVVCLRNPKDTVVSYYHHERMLNMHNYDGDFATYFDLFVDGLVLWGSYFDYALHLWEKRDHPNVCLLFYEDMKRDLESSVKKVAAFLHNNEQRLSDSQVAKLVDHLSFKSMKQNQTLNMENEFIKKMSFTDKGGSFVRKGEVGDWKNYFTDDMNKRMDEAIDKHFKGTGLEFIYE
eukprot:gene6300-7022_t